MEYYWNCTECGKQKSGSILPQCDECHRASKEASAEKDDYIQFNEQINQPDYYNWLPVGVSCVDISEHFPGNVAQAIQYIFRAGKKPGEPAEKDYSKAVWFLLREIQRIKTHGTVQDVMIGRCTNCGHNQEKV